MTIVVLNTRDDTFFEREVEGLTPILPAPINPSLETDGVVTWRNDAHEFPDANIGTYITHLSKTLDDIHGVRFCWLNGIFTIPILPYNYRFIKYTDSTDSTSHYYLDYTHARDIGSFIGVLNDHISWGSDDIVWSYDSGEIGRIFIDFDASTFAAGTNPKIDLRKNPFLAAFLGLKREIYTIDLTIDWNGNVDQRIYMSYPPDAMAGQRAIWVEFQFGEAGEMITSGGSGSPEKSFIVLPIIPPIKSGDLDTMKNNVIPIFYEEPERSKMLYLPSTPTDIGEIHVSFYTCVDHTWIPIDFQMANCTMKLEFLTGEDVAKKGTSII